ncbi:MAG: hypothetical protein JW818_06470 [Pirellulales bacterium]|nr:hypothetical protein [Pirellulales bacterium]
MRIACYAVGFGLIALFAGCDLENKAESLIKEDIQLMNKLADAIESGASRDEIKALAKKLEETEEALDKVMVTKAEKERLEREYSASLRKASARIDEAKMARSHTQMLNRMEEIQNTFKKTPRPHMLQPPKEPVFPETTPMPPTHITPPNIPRPPMPKMPTH